MDVSMDEEQIFFCELCNDDFSTKKDLYAHLKIHSKEDPFVCSICERKYVEMELLIGHMSIHSSKRASVCGICKNAFIDKSDLNAHARCHAEREPYFCDVYEMVFSKIEAKDDSQTRDVYAVTNLDGTGSMSYGYSGYEASNMIRHMRFHIRENEFFCKICKPKVYYAGGAEVRPQTCNENPDRGSFAAQTATNIKEEVLSFNEEAEELNERQRSDGHVPNESKRKASLFCDICRKMFPGKYDLLVHLRTHTKRKPFVCKLCKEVFLYKCRLKKHLCQFHPNEVPYVCEICRKSFSDRDRLITHLFTHMEGRAVVCETCKRGTYQKCNRDVHVLNHTREEPFICDVYERRFSDVEVIRHVRYHPEEKASNCELCKKGFSLEI